MVPLLVVVVEKKKILNNRSQSNEIMRTNQ